MRIAIIGSGISGLTAAWHLHKEHQISIFEKNNYFGGHTDTHNIIVDSASVNVDTGFIVFNEYNYPNFTSMLAELDVSYQSSDMSFSVKNDISGLSYNPSKGKKILAEPANFLKPSFIKMLLDIKKFYKAFYEKDIDSLSSDLLVKDYLNQNNYSRAFAKEHLYPMAGALWSMTAQEVETLPLKFILGFFSHHKMLQIKDRPEWKVVSNGSQQYVAALKNSMQNVEWYRQANIQSVKKSQQSNSHIVQYMSADNEAKIETFDAVIFACPADTALELIESPNAVEQSVLSAFSYTDNHMVLHSDASIMPDNENLWASWNVCANKKNDQEHYCITYWMNCLQNLQCGTQFFASLNPNSYIDESKIHLHRHYRHPKYEKQSFQAQDHWHEINGQEGRFFCGAYWGWGFHEDGAKSALKVVNCIQKQASKSLIDVREAS